MSTILTNISSFFDAGARGIQSTYTHVAATSERVKNFTSKVAGDIFAGIAGLGIMLWVYGMAYPAVKVVEIFPDCLFLNCLASPILKINHVFFKVTVCITSPLFAAASLCRNPLSRVFFQVYQEPLPSARVSKVLAGPSICCSVFFNTVKNVYHAPDLNAVLELNKNLVRLSRASRGQ